MTQTPPQTMPPALRAVALVLLASLGLLVLGALPAGAQDDDAPGIRGTLLREDDAGERVGVPGVDIIVQTLDGEEVGIATTAEDGAYELTLPSAGEYTATLDPGTLPEGVALRDPERNMLEFDVGPGQQRPIIFALGEGNAAGSTFLVQALQLFIDGLQFGLIIAITAIGLSLIFGTTGLVNFAHGELVTFGAIMAWIFNVLVGLPLAVAALVSIVVTAAFGGLQDRFFWRPLRKRGTSLISMLVISIGVSIFLRYAFNFQFGGSSRTYLASYIIQSPQRFGPITITIRDLITFTLAILVLFGVAAVLQRTRIGKAMRAVADNRDLAESSGINAEGVILFTWIFGSGLAAFGGVLFGIGSQVSFQMGFALLLLMFAGVTLGGLGTAYGALVGSLIVGVFIQMSTLFISPELKNVGALVVLILILLVRPQGILGRAERIG